MESGGCIGRTRDAVDVGALKLDSLLLELCHRVRIDASRSAAIRGIIEERKVGHCAIGHGDLHLHVA